MERLTFRLPVFEGPLDLLLHLIAKHKLDICDISIAELLEQYLAYLAEARRMDMELTSAFLEMASRLVQMKSAMLLPKQEKDPREELVTALLAYQACKALAALLAVRRREQFVRAPMPLPKEQGYRLHHRPVELAEAFVSARGKVKARRPPTAATFSGVVVRAAVSVTTRVLYVMRHLARGGARPFRTLFADVHGRSEAVATFLAVLELVRAGRVRAAEQDGGEMLSLKRKTVKWE